MSIEPFMIGRSNVPVMRRSADPSMRAYRVSTNAIRGDVTSMSSATAPVVLGADGPSEVGVVRPTPVVPAVARPSRPASPPPPVRAMRNTSTLPTSRGVALMVGAIPALAQIPPNVYVNSKQFNFAYQTGANVSPQPQTLQVISDPARNFTATATLQEPLNVANWLTVNGGSTTSGTTGQASSFVTVAAVPTGLPAGVYRGNIRVEQTGLPAATTDITVFLRVIAAPQVALNVPLVNLQGQTGTQISSPLVVNSTSTAVAYTATVSQYYGTASGWLSVAPATGTTAAAGNVGPNVNLTANLTGLAAGLYFAVVNFRAADLGDVSLPVVLTVTQTTTVSANPTRLDFAFQASNLSGTPNNKALSIVGSNASALPYTATVSGDSRVSISKTPSGGLATVLQGTTPETLYVIVNPAGIAAGTGIDATVTISTLQNSVTVPVRVTVTNAPLLSATPDAVTFAYTFGGTVPAAVPVVVNGTSTLGYTIAEAEVTGGDWLTATTANATTPGQINVSLNATRLGQLAAGTYTANITIASPAAGNTPLTVPVTLTVSGSSILTVSSACLGIHRRTKWPRSRPENVHSSEHRRFESALCCHDRAGKRLVSRG